MVKASAVIVLSEYWVLTVVSQQEAGTDDVANCTAWNSFYNRELVFKKQLV